MTLLEEKLKKITNTLSIDYLLHEQEDSEHIRKYYIINRLAYRLFHNRKAYLHMGISTDGKYKESDLEAQAMSVQTYINSIKPATVLELGYGQGANSFFLASKNPESNFFAIDLSTEPVKKYSHLKNLKFQLGDYHDLSNFPEGQFDIVFGFETICHSDHKEIVLEQVARILKPGGKLIIYDGYLNKQQSDLSEDEKLAAVLVEKGMAVNHFESLDLFEQKITKGNMWEVVERQDFSQQILPSLYRFERMAKVFFYNKFIAKVLIKLLPEMFICNALSGYLMPNLIESKVAVYYKHVLQKRNP